MATISVFNAKGGVGKTTCAIHLAQASVDAGYRTLLWEVDGQGDSSWLLSDRPATRPESIVKWIVGVVNVKDLIRPSRLAGLSLLSADPSMKRTDSFFASLVPGQNLARVFSELEANFDVIILDCPPGMGSANTAIMQFASLVVVPTIPSSLAMRGLHQVRNYLARHRGQHAPILPLFSIVDRRRKIHREALEAHPDWPVIPMLSALERNSETPLCAKSSLNGKVSSQIFAQLWVGIENKLRTLHQIRVRPSDNGKANQKAAPTKTLIDTEGSDRTDTQLSLPSARFWRFQRYQSGAV